MLDRLTSWGQRRTMASVNARGSGSRGVRLAPRLLFIVLALFAASCGGDSSSSPAPTPFVHFVPNSHAFWSNPDNWTTDLGPAYANILVESTNFSARLRRPLRAMLLPWS